MWPGGGHVDAHRINGQNRRNVNEDSADPCNRQTENRIEIKKHRDGGHLRNGLDLSEPVNLDACCRSDLCHPLPERCHGDFAAYNDQRDQHVDAVKRQQHNDGRTHHQLVGHTVEKRSHIGHHVVAARNIAVESIGNGSHHEHHTRQKILDVRT